MAGEHGSAARANTSCSSPLRTFFRLSKESAVLSQKLPHCTSFSPLFFLPAVQVSNKNKTDLNTTHSQDQATADNQFILCQCVLSEQYRAMSAQDFTGLGRRSLDKCLGPGVCFQAWPRSANINFTPTNAISTRAKFSSKILPKSCNSAAARGTPQMRSRTDESLLDTEGNWLWRLRCGSSFKVVEHQTKVNEPSNGQNGGKSRREHSRVEGTVANATHTSSTLTLFTSPFRIQSH